MPMTPPTISPDMKTVLRRLKLGRMLDTLPHLQPSDFPALRRRATDTLQVNLGYRCNQRCLHCHDDLLAKPGRPGGAGGPATNF